MTLPIERVPATLAAMWDAQREHGVAVRACTVNLVAVCPEPGLNTVARDTLTGVLPAHPGRAIVVTLAGGPSGVDAEAALVCGTDRERSGEACGEMVELTVKGEARAWAAVAIERLLDPGVRVHLWWLGDLPDDDALYDRLTEFSDQVTLDSQEMDLRDLRTLARLAQHARGHHHALGDLGWLRLRPWQELLARFFDDATVRPDLDRVRELRLTCAEHRRPPIEEPASTQAALFAGWFASRLGAHTSQRSWQMEKVPSVLVPRPDGGALTVRFETVHRSDVAAGALLQVELSSDRGSRFEVKREEHSQVLGWTGECEGAVIPCAVARVAEPTSAALLRTQLDRPLRDRLFEESLRAAAELIEPLYHTAANQRSR